MFLQALQVLFYTVTLLLGGVVFTYTCLAVSPYFPAIGTELTQESLQEARVSLVDAVAYVWSGPAPVLCIAPAPCPDGADCPAEPPNCTANATANTTTRPTWTLRN